MYQIRTLTIDNNQELIDRLRQIFGVRAPRGQGSNHTDPMLMFESKEVNEILGNIEFNFLENLPKAIHTIQESQELGGLFSLLIINLANLDLRKCLDLFKIITKIDTKVQILFTISEGQDVERVNSSLGRSDQFQILREPIDAFEFKQIIKSMIGKWYEGQKKDSIMANMRTAYQRAVGGLRMKQELLNVVGHELRTPLNVMILTFDYLKESQLNQQDKEMVDISHKAAHRLHTIVEAVMQYVAIDRADFRLQVEPVSISNVIQKLRRDYDPEINKKNLVVETHIDSNILEDVLVDAEYFSILLDNLFNNAIKFTTSGKITISVTLLASDEEDRFDINIRIKDTGIGIEKSHINEIFNLFYQVAESEEHSLPGTGIGLALCQKIVSVMGGNIGVTSSLGKGSEFWIEMKVRRALNRDAA